MKQTFTTKKNFRRKIYDKNKTNFRSLSGKMDIKQGDKIAVGKADANSVTVFLDLPLIHILSGFLGLELDGCHSRVQDILYANNYNS